MAALVVTLVSSSLCLTAHALFAEDAGKIDFLIATAGHGPVGTVHTAGTDVVITAADSSCHVASRSIPTGQLLWRRNVCTSTSTATSSQIRTTVSGSSAVTVDGAGVVRGWSVDDGALLWDRKVAAATAAVNQQLWGMKKDDIDYVVVANGKDLTVLDATTGAIVEDTISRKEAESSKLAADVPSAVSCFDVRISLEGDTLVAKRGEVTTTTVNVNADRVSLLSCTKKAAIILATSNRGTTSQITMSGDSVEIVWTQEDGLAQVTSALMLDASHDDIKVDQEADILQLQSRLKLQWKAVTSIFSLKEERRNHVFGFVKVAVLLSGSSHRVYGVDTVGDNRASIRYQVDLPVTAAWHRMIHGSANAVTGAHGVNGGAHTREVLILSYMENEQNANWVCIEGTSGQVHSSGSVALASPIVQIIPLAGKGKCRQEALLMLENHSLVSVTGDVSSLDASGMYVHVLDKQNGGLKSFGVTGTANSNGLVTHLVGTAAFPGEEIVTVAYPSREEVVQSPCDVLGDDSLLLKYLNPHLTVIVTMASLDESGLVDEFNLKPKKNTKKKRKPTGVTLPGQDATTAEEKPNLFVNLIDSVSGRILYRASHANALADPRPSVLVSENWVFYTFTNSKTKKAELGVLSLYEGLIDKNGLTAFTSPEQLTSFSSLEARETKPVVLAKTFNIPNAVTALGMTSTRSGISGRRLLLAGIDGQIHGVDRKMLEPRRPLGPLKDTEKKEGLSQYHELIQTVSYLSLTYDQTVESVRSIITAPTDLESQSLVLVFGGPDIFFARTSPSRGFDLLPDSFNKVLLSIVVIAMVGVLLVMQKMASKKIRKQGWV
jgi:ER membrane protein complex subunit 1, C-terminal